MRKIIFLILMVFCSFMSSLALPNYANASVILCAAKLVVFVNSPNTGATAHLVQLRGSQLGAGCASFCEIAGLDRAYIDFDDKEFLAFAMSAFYNDVTVVVQVENQAASKMGVSCKVLQMWADNPNA